MNVNAMSGAQRPTLLSVSTQRPLAAGRGNPDLQNLTKDDFELVYQATGVHIDKSSALVPTFAAQISIDRRNGMFAGGQAVDAAYLKNLVDLYKDKNDGMSDQAGLALQYLTNGKAPGRSVTL